MRGVARPLDSPITHDVAFPSSWIADSKGQLHVTKPRPTLGLLRFCRPPMRRNGYGPALRGQHLPWTGSPLRDRITSGPFTHRAPPLPSACGGSHFSPAGRWMRLARHAVRHRRAVAAGLVTSIPRATRPATQHAARPPAGIFQRAPPAQHIARGPHATRYPDSARQAHPGTAL